MFRVNVTSYVFKLIIFIRDMYTELFSCAKVLKNEVLLIVYSNSGLNFLSTGDRPRVVVHVLMILENKLSTSYVWHRANKI